MSILFAGSEPECFTYIGAVAWVTTADRFQSTHQRGAHVADFNTYLNTPNVGPQTNIWLRYYHVCMSTNGDSNNVIDFLDNAGNSRFRFVRSGNNIIAQYWNGSSYTNIGDAFPIMMSNYVTIHLTVNDVGGVYELYVGGTLVTSGTADFSSISNLASVRFGRGTGAGAQASRLHVSEVMIADTNLIGHQLYTIPPTGDGAHTDWDGDYQDIDENTLPDDEDFISGENVDDISTFTGAGKSLASGMRVKDVNISTRVLRGETGPQNLQGVIRLGGTDYTSDSVSLSEAFEYRSFSFPLDPSTSAAWDPAVAGGTSIEFGLKAIT